MFSLSNFFGYDGKINRKTYILSVLVLIGIDMLITFVLSNFMGINYDIRRAVKGRDLGSFIVNIVFIVSFISFLMLTAKRGREMGVAGILSLILGFFLSLVAFIIYAIVPGKR